jgi:retinol dehydrogenase-12
MTRSTALLGARGAVSALRRCSGRAAPRAAPRAVVAEASASGDKVCVITGANTGLGKQAALELSRKGFRVVGACRSRERGEAAARELAAAGGGMDVMELDLASFASVRAFAGAFEEQYGGRCDVLINNAGIMAPPSRTLTADGHEVQLGVNHLGHYLLTELLLEALLAAPHARVVSVASTAHLWGSIRFENLQSEGFLGYPALGWAAYGQSKLANVLFAYELHRRLRRAGADHVDVNAIHPGVVDTELPRNLPVNLWAPLKALGGIISVEQGAAGHVRLASDGALRGTSGRYFAEQSPGRPGVHEPARSSAESYDGNVAERLWEVSRDLTGATWAALS